MMSSVISSFSSSLLDDVDRTFLIINFPFCVSPLMRMSRKENREIFATFSWNIRNISVKWFAFFLVWKFFEIVSRKLSGTRRDILATFSSNHLHNFLLWKFFEIVSRKLLRTKHFRQISLAMHHFLLWKFSKLFREIYSENFMIFRSWHPYPHGKASNWKMKRNRML